MSRDQCFFDFTERPICQRTQLYITCPMKSKKYNRCTYSLQHDVEIMALVFYLLQTINLYNAILYIRKVGVINAW